jgi:hypothetical protein
MEGYGSLSNSSPLSTRQNIDVTNSIYSQKQVQPADTPSNAGDLVIRITVTKIIHKAIITSANAY